MNAQEMQVQPAGALLRMFALIVEELRRRELVRSSNNPVADIAELIAAKALDLQLVGKSSAGHDAVDARGLRYQVKGRRITPHNRSRQLSFIRSLESKPFDFLVGILFDSDFQVTRACVVPFEVVRRRAAFVASVNGHRFVLREEVWTESMVRDVTPEVVQAAHGLGCG
jgi:hypothetical protein